MQSSIAIIASDRTLSVMTLEKSRQTYQSPRRIPKRHNVTFPVRYIAATVLLSQLEQSSDLTDSDFVDPCPLTAIPVVLCLVCLIHFGRSFWHINLLSLYRLLNGLGVSGTLIRVPQHRLIGSGSMTHSNQNFPARIWECKNRLGS